MPLLASWIRESRETDRGMEWELAKMANHKLTVYFDGLCHLCSREIEHYKKQRGSAGIEFVDITSPQFQAEKEGLDPVRVHKEMHVRKANGTLVVGVDAFIAIWEVLPRFGMAAKLGRQPLANRLLRVGYQIFAKVRPYLPRRTRDCKQSPYCDFPNGKGA